MPPALDIRVRLIALCAAWLDEEHLDHVADLCADICADVIEMAPEMPGGHLGRAAHDGVQLLLELSCPDLDATVRDHLARASDALARQRAAA